MNYTSKHSSGFTLVEILISITIIGILAGIAGLSYSNVQERARDEMRLADLDTIAMWAIQYKAEHGHYPRNEEFGIGLDPNDTMHGYGPYGFYRPSADNPDSHRHPGIVCSDCADELGSSESPLNQQIKADLGRIPEDPLHGSRAGTSYWYYYTGKRMCRAPDGTEHFMVTVHARQMERESNTNVDIDDRTVDGYPCDDIWPTGGGINNGEAHVKVIDFIDDYNWP